MCLAAAQMFGCAPPADGGTGGGGGSDATAETQDSGTTDSGSGGTTVTPDAAAVTPDAATVTPDAATVTPDAATVTPDAAVIEPDAAVVTPDAAVVTPDAAVCVPNPEKCDGVDNNCDGNVDEGFDVGAACTSGLGACVAQGVFACADDGTAVCNVMAIPGSPEICDGLDNDCDGIVDNDPVCANPCESDFDCAEGQVCEQGLCVVPVDPCADVVCAEGEFCVGGACVVPEAPEGAVRLADGDGAGNNGRVEVYHNAQWGTICDDGWEGPSDLGFINGDVVCQQLGYLGAADVDYDGPDGVDPIWLDDVACVGGEAGIAACMHQDYGLNNCGHVEDVHVRCLTDGQCRVDSQCPAGLMCVEGGCVEAPPPVMRHLMLCGPSSYDVHGFILPGDNLDVVDGCAPDADTQALLIARDTAGQFDGATLAAYLDAGGSIITEYSVTNDVYNAIYGTEYADGQQTGSCQDNVVPSDLGNLDNQFWIDNAAIPAIDPANGGCGMDLSAIAGITRLGGWDANTTSLAYVDHGMGRLWLVEADWQDNEQGANGPLITADSVKLVNYMIHHASARGQVGSFIVSQGPEYAVAGQVSYSCVEACAMIFGGSAAEYGCSTVDGELNHRAHADGWDDQQFCLDGDIADDFKAPIDAAYDCGSTGCSYSAYVSDHSCQGVNYCWRGAAAEGSANCANNPLWQPVTCQVASWVWSNDRAYTDVPSAEANAALFTGCTHSGDGNDDGQCSLTGTGWISVDKWTMAGCDASWEHLGGNFTGPCGGHDGDTVRRLVTGDNGCYDYRGLAAPGVAIPVVR